MQFHRNVVLWKYYKRSSNNDARLAGQVSLTCCLEPSCGAINLTKAFIMPSIYENGLEHRHYNDRLSTFSHYCSPS